MKPVVQASPVMPVEACEKYSTSVLISLLLSAEGYVMEVFRNNIHANWLQGRRMQRDVELLASKIITTILVAVI